VRGGSARRFRALFEYEEGKAGTFVYRSLSFFRNKTFWVRAKFVTFVFDRSFKPTPNS
jgi:hypothetical protein